MAWKYVGDGAFIPGVPAKDLSDKDVRDLNIEEAVRASDLYKQEKKVKKPSGDA
jgi:hypothetical protein